MALTPKQQRFVDEYLIDLNATRAAKAVGYSDRSARQQGARLLTNADIAAAVKVAQDARSERTEISQDRVLQELAVVAFSDLTHYEVDESGRLVVAEGVKKAATRAVSSKKRKVRMTLGGDRPAVQDVEVEIKLWNKIEALKLLGNHLGLFKDPTPFEALLGLLPPELAGQLREAFSRAFPGGSPPAGRGAATPPV